MPYLSGYTGRQPITAQQTQVIETITGFAHLLNLSQMEQPFWDLVKTDGSDIRVTLSDGTTEVPIHVAEINKVAKTGVLFFKADTNASADVDFFVYANGSASAYAKTDPNGQYAVYTDFDYVWLLNETPTGAADEIEMAAGTGHEGTYQNTVQTPISGPVSEMTAIDLDRSQPNYIDLNDQIDIENTHTMMAWLRFTTIGLQQTILSNWHANDNTQRHVYWRLNAANDMVFQTNDPATSTPITISTATWYHLVWTVSSGVASYYKDGAAVTMDDANVGAPSAETTTNKIGARNASGGSSYQLDAAISMIMVNRDTQFSANKIATYYNNQNAPGTFWSIGTWETDSSGVTDVIDAVALSDTELLAPAISITSQISDIQSDTETDQPTLSVDTQMIVNVDNDTEVATPGTSVVSQPGEHLSDTDAYIPSSGESIVQTIEAPAICDTDLLTPNVNVVVSTIIHDSDTDVDDVIENLIVTAKAATSQSDTDTYNPKIAGTEVEEKNFQIVVTGNNSFIQFYDEISGRWLAEDNTLVLDQEDGIKLAFSVTAFYRAEANKAFINKIAVTLA